MKDNLRRFMNHTVAAHAMRAALAAGSLLASVSPVIAGAAVYAGASEAAMIEAYADTDKDYTIGEAWWDFDYTTGDVKCRWEKAESSTSYKLAIYKTSKSKAVRSFAKVSGSSFDATSYIANNGTGNYYFEIYSVKGGTDTLVTSETLEIDSASLKVIKNRNKTAEAEVQAGKLGWEYQLDGTWKYYKEGGVLAKNEWLDYNGQKFHFSSKGIMQTGWQQVSNKWYYFDKNDGHLYVSTTTPDGYTVNENGEYVVDGQVVSSKGTSSSAPVLTKLSKATVSVSEKSTEAGKLSTTTFSAGTGFTIESTSYSIPQEQWTPGCGVTVSMVLKPANNYEFSSSTTFSVRGCDVQVTSRSADTARITFYYNPKMTLESPTDLYISEETTLNWRKVDHASRYKVVVYENTSQLVSEIITTNSYDLSAYFDYEGSASSGLNNINVKVYAMGSKSSSKYFLTSKATEIQDLDEWAQTHATNGKISYTSDSMTMRDEDGNRVKGWQFMMGSWYYFQKNGTAAGPGWQQIEGEWYYFDSEHKMKTGWIEDGGYQYFLSDGSVGTLGAMQKGHFTDVNGVTYNLNDGSVAGIPEGARY